MSIHRPVLVALTLLLVTEGTALAQEAGQDRAIDAELARSVVRNVRRSIAIGPTLGAFSAYAPSPSDVEGGLSFGLAAELFESSLPSRARMQEIAQQKAKEKLAQIIQERYGGQPPDAATLNQLVREVVAQIKAEVLASVGATPPLLERPRLAIALEANYLFSSADWLARLGVGVGVGPVSIGPTFSARFGDDTVARLGAELSIHLLPTRSPRSPVLDLFLRGDFELHARSTNDDQVTLGLRVLLDLI